MFYNEKTVTDISRDILLLFDKFKNDYEELKGGLNVNEGDFSVIWSRNVWAEPFNSDFISELDEGTVTARNILKSKPRKIIGCSEHYYDGGKPVYSVFWGESNEPVCEKLFVHGEDGRIGLMYICGGKRLSEVSREFFDDEGNALRYECGRLLPFTKRGCNEFPEDMPWEIEIKARTYYYEKGAIARAEAFDGYNSSKPLIWYDDKRYEGAGNILPVGCAPMNPGRLCEYFFQYGNEGCPETFTRKNFFYGKVTENTWKFKASLNKAYSAAGIGNFQIK